LLELVQVRSVGVVVQINCADAGVAISAKAVRMTA
jgi:hypothetical protein